VDDFDVAEATDRAAVARWPRARITLPQGIRVVHDTGPVRWAKIGPIAAEAGGIEVEVTGRGAFEAVDRAMDSAGCARLADVEADMVAMAADALPNRNRSAPAWKPAKVP
jgi:hypothetical protein